MSGDYGGKAGQRDVQPCRADQPPQRREGLLVFFGNAQPHKLAKGNAPKSGALKDPEVVAVE